MSTFTVTPQGPFSLEQSVRFGFGQRHSEEWTGSMRLTFCIDDGYTQHAGVEVTQSDDGLVHGEIQAPQSASPQAIQRQVERILSINHDARAYGDMLAADPILSRLAQERPGLRPPLFYSPYEAAAWGVLSARFRQAGAVRERLSAEHGTTFTFASGQQSAFPSPEQLLQVQEFEGLPPTKLERLHGVAHAAMNGQLDVETITSMDPDEAIHELQRIPGIGPFYAALIVIRGAGITDYLPAQEGRMINLVTQLWQLPSTPTASDLETMFEPWRPFRTWVAVLIRAAGPSVLAS